MRVMNGRRQALAFLILITAAAATSGQAFLTFQGGSPGDDFGRSVDDAGDFDGDGVRDVVVGAVSGAFVYSGCDGSVLCTIGGGGFQVAGIGDIDNDGRSEVLVGTPAGAGPPNQGSAVFGTARIFGFGAGGVGVLKATHVGSIPADQFGICVGGGLDVDGDQVPDYVIGTRHFSNTGAVTAYSGASGASLWTTSMPGQFVDIVADLDGDGLADVIFADRISGSSRAFAALRGFDGASILSPLVRTVGTESDASHRSMSGVGDVNGDGCPDLALGLWSQPAGFFGQVDIVCGNTGALLTSIANLSGGGVQEQFGFAVVGGNDVTGDGQPNLVVAAPGIDTVAVFDLVAGVGVLHSTLSGLTGVRDVVCVDVDSDGVYEIVVGALSGTGQVSVISLAGTLATYPGSGADFELRTSSGASPLTLCPVKVVAQGNVVTINFASPGGSFVFTPPILAAQLFATGTPPNSPGGFPEVHLDPAPSVGSPPVLLFNGPAAGILAPLLLPPGGITLAGTVPLFISGQSILVQAFVLSSAAPNGIFAATDAHEFRVM